MYTYCSILQLVLRLLRLISFLWFFYSCSYSRTKVIIARLCNVPHSLDELLCGRGPNPGKYSGISLVLVGELLLKSVEGEGEDEGEAEVFFSLFSSDKNVVLLLLLLRSKMLSSKSLLIKSVVEEKEKSKVSPFGCVACSQEWLLIITKACYVMLYTKPTVYRWSKARKIKLLRVARNNHSKI